MMQSHGYVYIHQEKVLVLFRDSQTGRNLKRRDSGADGTWLFDESLYLDKHPEIAKNLIDGMTVIV